MTTDKTEPYVKDSMNDVKPPGPMKETCCSRCIETADETTENVDISPFCIASFSSYPAYCAH